MWFRRAPGSFRTSVRCPAELEAFLEAGEAPVYFGFGSIRAPHDLNGWAGLDVERSEQCRPCCW